MNLDEVQKNQEAIILSSKSLERKVKFLESLPILADKIHAFEEKYNLCIQGSQYRITD